MKPIHKAAKAGDLESLEQCLDQGEDVDARDDKQITPLMYAARIGHQNLVSLLIDKGADLLALDEDGLNSLMYAAICKSPNSAVVQNKRHTKFNGSTVYL